VIAPNRSNTRANGSVSQFTYLVRAGASVCGTCVMAFLSHSVGAQEQEEPPSQEISVQAERQTALDQEAMTISETPNAGPQSRHLSAIVGFGPLVSPAYDGSKKTKVSPFPYVDIRGLLGGRLYLSSLDGLGVNLFNAHGFRGGLTVGPSGGRTSSDDPHLNGLPDISTAAAVGAFLSYSFRPFAVQAKIDRRVGSNSGTKGSLGVTYAVAPIADLHLSFSADMNWADKNYQQAFFGISSVDSARTAAVGNPLPAYAPGAGLIDVGVTAAAVYQVGNHWGLVARFGLHDLAGTPPRNSPLVQRQLQPSFAIGALYKF
jgi:MipA family protein